MRNAQVDTVSHIGKPIDSDAVVDIQLVTEDMAAAQRGGECIAQQVLAGPPNVWQGVMRCEFSLY